MRIRTLALGAGITVLLCVPLAISVAASANSDVLISRGRPAIASSERGGVWEAGQATDSDPSSRWESAPGPGTQWVRIDLGGVRDIDRVVLRWDKTYARTYRVQTSVDGANWTDVYATRAGNGGVDDLKRLGGSGRYVRVLATQRAASTGGYALFEIKAYGPSALIKAVAVHPAGGSIAAGLEDRRKKETALELVSSAENSTLSWRQEYGYIEDIGDGRGYTAGIVGFCSGTSDMLEVVEEYTRREPGNVLAAYLPALRTVDGSDSHAGLDPGFPAAWKAASRDPVFQKVQEDERDKMYFWPAVRLARTDGLRALGQFAYYDAAVMHGVSGLKSIRQHALTSAKSPAQGGDEPAYLDAFLDARVREMRTEEAHSDTTRVDTAQRLFLRRSNLDLAGPLTWKVYGDQYRISGP
ncbi:chitosanase [Paractinoplanes globisporus]|uniref:Chitosanase n=1 Tax=Paractinoplanes globisporus TaxID=113565 RepID=A0ABW6WKG7_9ACTN|nr:chitosanase [Actinoplanes globisporus]